MKHYLLIDEDNNQIDYVYAFSLSQAKDYFFIDKHWAIGDIYTLEEYQDQLNLDAYENQYM